MLNLNRLKGKSIAEIILFLAIVIVGAIFVWYTWMRIENQQSEYVLQIARSIVTTLPKEDLKALDAKPGDTGKPQYQGIKKTLKEIIRVNPKARFAYLYCEQNRKLFFLVDSEPENSKDCSPPGQEYSEADLVYRQPLKTGKEIVTDPVTDRWGTWISVLIPIKDLETGRVLAIFAMDFNSRSWDNTLLFEVLQSSMLFVLLLVAFLFSINIKGKNRSLKSEVAERRLTEEMLRESEEKYRLIFEHTPVGLLSFDEHGNIIACNDKFVQIIGSSRQALIGLNMLNLTDKKIVACVQEALNGNAGLYEDVYHSLTSKKITTARALFAPMGIGGGRVRGGVGIIEDITERRQAEAALSQSKERARIQRNAIARIVENEVVSTGDLTAAFHNLTEEVSYAVRVERASIWLLSDDKTVLRCIALYEDKTKQHSAGSILRYEDYPRYFEAIRHDKRINAEDAQNDPRTSEFTESYLGPLGITSMLDAGIYTEGELKGVICLEHIGEMRTWYSDEESFASTIASIVSQILANNNRKITEEALRLSEEKYRNDFMFQRSILESPTDIIIFALDKNYCYTAFTKFHRETIKKIWGADIQIGMNMLDVMSDPEDRQKAKTNFDRALQGEYFVLTEDYGDRKLYRTLYENYYSSIKNSDESIVGVSVFVIDITERKRSEEALRLKDWAIESSISAIAISDLSGSLNYANPSFIKLWGYNSLEDALGRSPESFWLKGEKAAEIKETLIDRGSWSGEMVAQKKDGTLIDIQVEASIVTDAEGRAHSMLASFSNITERKHAEEVIKDALIKAEAGSRLKTAFMNNISHEIRTPLNGILGFTTLITEPDITTEEKEQFHSLIRTSSNRLLSTITNYMDISLMASGTMEVKRKSIDLHHVLNQLSDQFQPLCTDKNLELHLEIPERKGVVTISTDVELFQKILSHILDNAVKFTYQGEISFGYIIQPGAYEFYVKDTGIGISLDSHSIIFESFVQEELSFTRGHEGSGLGLSIAQGLVRLLGGEMRVDSVKESGSTFFFTLPYEGKNEEIAVPDAMIPEVPVMGSPVVLVAEDYEPNLQLIKAIFKKSMITVLSACNGKEAVAQCREHPEISLVLMDIKMPVMDGLKATSEIRSFMKNVPIIAITAYGMTGDEKKALESGCNDYLAKPFGRAVLLNKLKKYGIRI